MKKLNLKYLNETSRKEYLKEYQQLLSDKTLQVETYHKATILPLKPTAEWRKCLGGVVNENHEYVNLSAWVSGGGEYMNEGYEITEPKKSTQKVIFCGVYKHHWGHFLLESTIRLWYYLSLSSTEQEQYKLVFLCRGIEPVRQELEFFELLGVKDKCIWLKEPTQFDTVIVPEGSHVFGAEYTKEFALPFLKIAESIPPSSLKKIYFTRTAYKENSNTIGEEKIEQLFRKNHYTILSPEKLSLREQIAIFKGAEDIALLSGSACHTSLFVHNKSNMTILTRFSMPNISQLIIDSVQNLKPTYVDCYLTFLPVTHGDGPFWVGITRNLIALCKDRGLKIPFNLKNIKLKELYYFLKRWKDVYMFPDKNEWIANAVSVQHLPCDIENFIMQTNADRRQIMFDADWYQKTYHINHNQEEHYYTTGWKLGYNPSLNFDTNAYLNTYPDIKEAQMCPLYHYINWGRYEGRQCFSVKTNSKWLKMKQQFMAKHV